MYTFKKKQKQMLNTHIADRKLLDRKFTLL